MTDAKRDDPLDTPRALTRDYAREARVQTQIRDLCALSARARKARLAQDDPPNTPRRLQEETLVYFARTYRAAGDEAFAWELMALLNARVAGHIGRKLDRWRLPEAERDECTEALFVAMYEAVWSLEPQCEFWEIRFWVCLDRRLNLLAQRAQQKRDAELRPADGGEDEDTSAAEGFWARLADTGASPEERAVRQSLLARLLPNERMALYLKTIEGLPEESQDPARLTIARILKVSGRTVRTYLRSAERKLFSEA